MLVRARALRSRAIIVFLVPHGEFISGGLLSIYNLYRMSVDMKGMHQASVVMCFTPGRFTGRWSNAAIDRQVTICPFRLALLAFPRAKNILVHVPEYLLESFAEQLGLEKLKELSRQGLRLNILNQNVRMMPSVAVIDEIRKAVPDVTCTCAHPSYSTCTYQKTIGIPVHHLPAWTYPCEPVVSAYEEKENVFLISPDRSEWREPVLKMIRRELPHLHIEIVSNMPFHDYLKLAQRAKFSLTFGEGLDDYFIGVFLRGGIGFAVYNEEFFTDEFREAKTVYPDWPALMSGLVADLRNLEEKSIYDATSAPIRGFLKTIWSADKTERCLRSYYQGKYSLFDTPVPVTTPPPENELR